MTVRVLIVDDHAHFRGRVRRLLTSAGYEVVGEAGDAAGAIAEVRRLAPDLVLLDIQLPDRDGLAVAAEIARLPRAPRTVLISSREAADYGSRLRTVAAEGFIHKPDLTRARLRELAGSER